MLNSSGELVLFLIFWSTFINLTFEYIAHT